MRAKTLDEPPKHQLKTSLRFLRRQLGNRWLLANDVLQFRDEIDDQLSVRLQRLTKRVAPRVQVVFVLAEERPDQALKRLRQRGIRNVALVLVELARCKQAARRDQRLVELVDDRGLADAGVSGDEHQLRPAARDDAIERGEQGVDLAVPPVQLLGDHQAIRNVICAQREIVDASVETPIATGSAADRAQRPPLSDTAPRPVFASSFIVIAETAAGTLVSRSLGAAGCRAMWQCTHSIGSDAVNGRLPVSIS